MNSITRKTLLIIVVLLQFSAALSTCATLVKATGSVEILSNTGYLDAVGNYRVVGEVQNVGNQAVNFVQVTAQFYDSDNNFVDSRFDLTLLYVILAGRKSPFEIALLDATESALVSRYSMSVTYVETADLPLKLRILSDANYTDASGNLHTIGDLKNLGTEKLVNAKVVATYYDAYSRVVAVASIGFDPEIVGDINPNQTIQFQIDLPNERAQYAHTYSLAAESNQYTMIPEHPTPMLLLILLPPITLILITKRSPINKKNTQK